MAKPAPMIIGDTAQAAEVLKPLFVLSGETVAVIHLGPEQRLIAVTLEATGGEEDVELPIGAILKKALRLGAHALVVAHNHPSGDPSPSAADHQATRALAGAADKVGIRLHDHIIFGGGENRSFRALGLL